MVMPMTGWLGRAVHRLAGRAPSQPAQGGKIPAPTVEEIVAAARDYERARKATNAAAKVKRVAEKILKRTPDGVYGPLTVERVESSREVTDLDEIRRIFALHGLGDVPMKPCAPSITFTWAVETSGDVAA